jgi:hypothetical protein
MLLIYWEKNITNRNTDDLLDHSEGVFLEVNEEKTKYIFLYCHHTAGQNHNINVANKFLKNVEKLKYFRLMVRNENCIHKEIKSR